MRNNTTLLLVWMLAVLTASPRGLTPRFGPLESSGAKSPEDDYLYCVLTDESQTRRAFFSVVFSGDNVDQRNYELQFSAYVRAKYRGVIGTAACPFNKSRSAAVGGREDDKMAAGRERRAVIETNWRP